jgi:hypothetical protein
LYIQFRLILYVEIAALAVNPPNAQDIDPNDRATDNNDRLLRRQVWQYAILLH